MTPDAASSPHSLATASGLLFGALGLAMGVGALIGWAAGSPELGLLVGALAGIPLGVFAVYYVYTRAEPQTTAGHARPLQTQNGTGDAARARQASPLRAQDDDDEDSW
jgi:hypothetical protein